MSGCLHLLLSMYVSKSTVATGHGGMLVFKTYLLMSGHARGHACGQVGHGGQYTALGQVDDGFGVGAGGSGVGHVLLEGGGDGIGVGGAGVGQDDVLDGGGNVEVVGQVPLEEFDDGDDVWDVGVNCTSTS
jgi:hypothetical protein